MNRKPLHKRVAKYLQEKDWIYDAMWTAGPVIINTFMSQRKESLRGMARFFECSPTYLCKIRKGDIRMGIGMYHIIAENLQGR